MRFLYVWSRICVIFETEVDYRESNRELKETRADCATDQKPP